MVKYLGFKEMEESSMQVARDFPNDDLVDCISHSEASVFSHLQSGKNNLCLAEGVSIKELWKLWSIVPVSRIVMG